jgi:hypothetical protein
VIVGLREDHAPGVMEEVQPVPDRLTGLAERHEFTRQLRAVLSVPEGADPDWEHSGVVVLAVNLDSFRHLNNLHGFGIGDQVLALSGSGCLWASDEAFGIGGEGARQDSRSARRRQFGNISGQRSRPRRPKPSPLGCRMVQNPIAIGAQSIG